MNPHPTEPPKQSVYVPKGTQYRAIVFGPRGAYTHLSYSPKPFAVIYHMVSHAWIGEGDRKARYFKVDYDSYSFFASREEAEAFADKKRKTTFGSYFNQIRERKSLNMPLAKVHVYDEVAIVRAVVLDRFNEPDAPRVRNRPVLEGYREKFAEINAAFEEAKGR